MGRRKEYIDTLVLSKQEINSIKRAQFEMRMEGFTNQNEEKLRQRLSAFTNVLSFAFKLPTAVTLAAAAISAITSSPSERDVIINVCRNGEDYLEQLWNIMDDNPNYELIEVQLPFLEFIDEGFRIVQGRGIVKAVKVGGYWIPM
ncbi:hypothetical protein KQI88_05725 [Alkaliphilus sp. MSJ-5]|uniref:Uncharacterized protein n=1 Tax=Alkaliphilus flagellatus TaxID=2841507 RepID=A0ABS6G075_9FIRM|nr:hypothetical protein [Alkaliphilus flagellatus]MBU5675907.1 hypothetical protein [Alkaliphilus flagellatus]